MDQEEQDGSEVLETTEEEVLEETQEEVDERDAKIAELEAKNKQLFERVKKGEKIEPSQSENLSIKDNLALIEAKVSADDLDEVIRIAKVLGLPVAEALKNDTMKTILNAKAEEKRTAQVTITRGGARSGSQTGEDLLRKAELTGEVPTTTEGMKALAEARHARRVEASKR